MLEQQLCGKSCRLLDLCSPTTSVYLLFVSFLEQLEPSVAWCALCCRCWIQLLLVPVTSCSASAQSWLSQVQNALQPSTDGLGSRYTVLSCLYTGHKELMGLKQLLCVNQTLLFSSSFFCLPHFPVLFWALSGWPHTCIFRAISVRSWTLVIFIMGSKTCDKSVFWVELACSSFDEGCW